MIKSIISDLGNVIVFFDNMIFLQKVVPFSKYSIEEITSLLHNKSDLFRLFDLGKLSPSEFFWKIRSLLKLKIEEKAFFHDYNDIFSLNEPVMKILKGLSNSYKLVLLSNTDVMRFGFVKENFPEILFFDEYVLSFEEGRMKPDPEIYKSALQKAGTKAEETVFIDDRQENIKTAQALGLMTVLYDFQSTNLGGELRKLGMKL
ncbi:MAG: HAD family hydrolase [Acidobacteriota bacterium]